jgi:hypothetical protein
MVPPELDYASVQVMRGSTYYLDGTDISFSLAFVLSGSCAMLLME